MKVSTLAGVISMTFECKYLAAKFNICFVSNGPFKNIIKENLKNLTKPHNQELELESVGIF